MWESFPFTTARSLQAPSSLWGWSPRTPASHSAGPVPGHRHPGSPAVLPTRKGPSVSLSWGPRAGPSGFATWQTFLPSHHITITRACEIIFSAMLQTKPRRHRGNPAAQVTLTVKPADGSQSSMKASCSRPEIPEQQGRCLKHHRTQSWECFWGTGHTHTRPPGWGWGPHLQLQPAGRLCPCPIDEGPSEPLLTVGGVARWPPVDEVPQVLWTEDPLRGPHASLPQGPRLS